MFIYETDSFMLRIQLFLNGVKDMNYYDNITIYDFNIPTLKTDLF